MQHTEKQKYVYLVSTYHMCPSGYFKVGISQNYKARLTQLQSSSPFMIMLECVVEVDNPYQLEQNILCEFKQHRIRGEWFSVYSYYDDEDVIKKSYLLIKKIKKYMMENSIRRVDR